MQRILTYLVKAISYLPFSVLYTISTFLYFVVYRLLGYRKEVVERNLTLSFPEKSKEEINQIMDRFYRNLCDVLVESIKMISMSENELRTHATSPEHCLLDRLNAEGRTCFYFAGHLGNWEWSPNVAGLASQVKLWGVYTKITNKAFNKLITKYRSRFGCEMILMEHIARRVLTDKDVKNICFIADQTPSNPEANIWVDFMNQQTLAFSASAKLAKKINAVIIYASIIRKSRGYYEYKFEVLFENPQLYSEQEIMQAFFSRLEKDIRKHPVLWLWSHKRWKHKPKETLH